MNNKILIGGLIGGIAAFLLGWVIYGMALQGLMEANTTEAAKSTMRAEEDMVWWAMILGNLALGFLFALIYGRWANISTFKTGAIAGAVIGLLWGLSFDLMMYSMSTLYTLTGVAIDVIAFAVMCALVGGIVAWWLGRK